MHWLGLLLIIIALGFTINYMNAKYPNLSLIGKINRSYFDLMNYSKASLQNATTGAAGCPNFTLNGVSFDYYGPISNLDINFSEPGWSIQVLSKPFAETLRVASGIQCRPGSLVGENPDYSYCYSSDNDRLQFIHIERDTNGMITSKTVLNVDLVLKPKENNSLYTAYCHPASSS
jgi:hypothetical protein